MSRSTFFETLGWSLIDSLWQVGAIWVFYTLLTRNGSRFSAEQRHSLAFGGMMTGSILFFVTIIINWYSVATNNEMFSLAYFVDQQAGSWFNGKADAIVSILSFIYLPVLMYHSLRLLFQVVTHRNNYKRNLTPVHEEISLFLDEMISRLGISKKTMVWLSDKVESPLTLGFWKPVVLLPVSLFTHLSYSQITAVIAHEVFHIKRNDYLLNIFLTVAEIVLFFNPFAKMLAATVKKERENSCDDGVIETGFDALEYSHALYTLGRFTQQQGRFSMAATGIGKEYLLQRIRRMMKGENPRPSFAKPVIAFFFCLFVAGFASRNKQVPVLAENVTATIEYKPATYYSERRQVEVAEPVVMPKPVPRPTLKAGLIEKNDAIVPVPPPPPAPLEPTALEDADEDVLVTSYVASPEVIEFTMLDPADPVVPDAVGETPQPFVPKATFYFTEIDSTSAQTVICL